MSQIAGVVEEVWRYPIKSTGGERLQGIAVDERGVAGDRLYAVRDADGKFGSGKSTRRFRRMDGLLRLRSRYPDGLGIPNCWIRTASRSQMPRRSCAATSAGTTSRSQPKEKYRTSTSLR